MANLLAAHCLGLLRPAPPIGKLTDWLRAVRHAAENDQVSGPVNVVLPNPVRNSQFTKELAAGVEEQLEGLRGYAEDAGERIREFARERPIAAIVLAAGVGFVLGRLMSRT